MHRIPPASDRVSEHPAQNRLRRGHRPPERQARPVNVERLERNGDGHVPLGQELERVADPRRPAAAATGIEQDVRSHARIVEVALLKLDALTPTHRLTMALELLV